MSAAAGAAAAAAAAQARMREEEEHTLTTYNNQDLNGWEFKIVRSVTRIKGDRFKQLCSEEARNGWELVEKFDDYRIRFKRPVECRQSDGNNAFDPYRTQFGISETRTVLLGVGGALLIMGIVLAILL